MTSKSGHIQAEAVSADSVLLLDVLRGVLDRCGGQRWLIRPDQAWCSVISPTGVPRKHGWKLHVSATPLSAPLVLARVAEVLVRRGCSFKFATDIARVIQLVSPHQDRGAGGKFITVYPRDDEQIRVLAAELDRATVDQAGPRILSDRQVRPGSLVHYRYGEFTNDAVFTDEGLFDSRMVGPDRSEVKDERHPWFSPPVWAVPPFPEPAVAAKAPGTAILLGGRFRVTGALRHSNKGGVYQAVDERDGRKVVIKQARAHVGAALDGSDVRDLLRHEARMLELLAPLSVFPAAVALFEEQGDLFLAEEEISGTTSDDWAASRDQGNQLRTDDVIRIAGQLVQAVRSVHEAGLVLCDLKPGNIIITPDNEVRLIDAEVIAEQGQQRVRGYTIGFAAPEFLDNSSKRQGPQTPADCFSLGVTLFCLASGGLEAHWVSGRPGAPRSSADRQRLLSQIAADRTVLLPLAELIVGLTEADPDQRWTLDQAEKFLASLPQPHTAGVLPAGGLMPADGLDRLLADGMEHLRQGMAPHELDLWRSSLTRLRYDPCDAWRGASGVLATLTRAARSLEDPSLRAIVAQTAAWIDERLFDIPRILPGLCFGRAGTAWALHEAGRLLEDDRLTSRAVKLANLLPTNGPNPDVAFGLSGAGLARLYLWQATGDTDLLRGALDCAESVLEATQRSGADWLWPVSVPVASSSHVGQYNSYGFAHGVAGTATFLLAAAQAAVAEPAGTSTGQAERLIQAAIGAGDTLLRGANLDQPTAVWPTIAGGSDFRRGAGQLQWCNGQAGIGTFLIRLWVATGQQRFADMAIQCAPIAADDWAVSMGACCGLSGAGHFLLDLAEFTSDNRFHARAEQMATAIYAQAGTADLRVTCPPENGYAYAEGTAGVLDFLLRLRHGGPRPWLPEIHPMSPRIAAQRQDNAARHQRPIRRHINREWEIANDKMREVKIV